MASKRHFVLKKRPGKLPKIQTCTRPTFVGTVKDVQKMLKDDNPRLQPGPTHIDLKRLWSYVGAFGEMDEAEYAHLSDCDHCRAVFRICVLSETLEDVEMEVNREFNSGESRIA